MLRIVIRLLAAITVFIGCSLCGVSYGQQYICRISVLEDLIHFLKLLEREITYHRGTLAECCNRIAKHMQSPYREALAEILSVTDKNSGTSFCEIFRAQMNQVLEDFPLKDSDREAFYSFCNSTYADERLQRMLLAAAREKLEDVIGELKAEKKAKCRMALGLGSLGGFFLLILLL